MTHNFKDNASLSRHARHSDFEIAIFPLSADFSPSVFRILLSHHGGLLFGIPPELPAPQTPTCRASSGRDVQTTLQPTFSTAFLRVFLYHSEARFNRRKFFDSWCFFHTLSSSFSHNSWSRTFLIASTHDNLPSIYITMGTSAAFLTLSFSHSLQSKRSRGMMGDPQRSLLLLFEEERRGVAALVRLVSSRLEEKYRFQSTHLVDALFDLFALSLSLQSYHRRRYRSAPAPAPARLASWGCTWFESCFVGRKPTLMEIQ